MNLESEILKYFKTEELLDILQNLIRKKSENPIGTEEEAGRYIHDIFTSSGISTRLSWVAPGRPNVIATLKGKKPGPRIIYNGHLDVVPAGEGWSLDPFSGIIRDNRVYGRGASDMKAGLAAMTYAAIVLNRLGNPFFGELILFFNVDEERSNLGMKHFLKKEDVRADFVVIGEPTDIDICLGHRGCARLRVKTKGTPGHTSVIKDPDNAIYKMNKLITALEELGYKIKDRVDCFLGSSSLIVSQITGGTAPNIVPSHCEVEIDRRILPRETYEGVMGEIDACLQQVAKKYSFKVELDCYLFLPATVIDANHSQVKHLRSVASRVRDKKINVKPFRATTEAPFFSVDRAIPTVIFGPGSINQAHIVDEYVEIQDVIDAAYTYIRFLTDKPDK